MADHKLFLEQQLNRCEQSDQKGMGSLFRDLNDTQFLTNIDDSNDYNNKNIPPNLLKLLICIAQKGNDPVLSDGFADLSNSRLYSKGDPEGTLRCDALIIASGNISAPTKNIISFLEEEVASNSQKSGLAVQALSQMGTSETMAILWNHIFNTQSTVIPEHLQDVYLPNYAMELCLFRDKIAVLSFLVDTLYYTELKKTVISCITDDVTERGPEAEYNLNAAPLNRETSDGILLAKKLSAWMIVNGEEIKAYHDFKAVTVRVPDLLGIKPSEPISAKPDDVKQWVVEQFERAMKTESDSERKSQIQAALGELK